VFREEFSETLFCRTIATNTTTTTTIIVAIEV